MPKSLVIAAVAAVLVVAAVPNFVLANAPARGPIASAPGYLVPVYAGTSAGTFAAGQTTHAPSGVAVALTSTSTIKVTYTGFSAQAKAAFQAAVDVWQSIVVSDQVIHVDAHWSALGSASGILGQAGANNIYLESDNFWYPGPLEEARCHCNADTGTEIRADFNSQFPYWYYGTDGNVPNSKWDLETVVLHELGHGLGFFSSFTVNGTKGYWGFNNKPLRFDYNEYNAAVGGAQMVSFNSASARLKTELTDKSVYIGGPHLQAAIGGRARLYAPTSWQQGSSNSHLDETQYAPRTVNALMTPVLNNGESIHDPGPIVKAIFQDIGWTIAGSASAPGAPHNVTATAGDAAATVSWSAPSSNGGSAITGYDVTSDPGNKTCHTNAATSCNVTGLNNGVPYTFTVTASNNAGTGPASDPSNSVVPHASSGDTTPPSVAMPGVTFGALQTMTSTVTVRVAWPAASDASGIASYDLQVRQGSGAWMPVTLATATSTSGNVSVARASSYSFRVRATDGVGNVGDWTQTTPAQVSTVQETGASYTGSWTLASLTGASGGKVYRSSVTDDVATFNFTGTSVAFVSTLARGRGIAEVKIDGTPFQVDLYASSKHAKVVVWASDLLSPGSHTLQVRVTGTKNSQATSTRIDVDAFLTWP